MAFRSYRAPSFNFLQRRGAVGGRVLQRRCACGSKAESDGECRECAEKEGMLQRKSQSDGSLEAPPIVHEVLHAPGRPLDAESRDFMEAHFGYDFSHVRVHSDAQAQRSADATNAEAYTVGHDIVFASGRYAPETAAGRRLLAHELTHVVQQDSGAASSSGMSMQRKPTNDETTTPATATPTAASPTAAAPTAAAPGPCLEEVTGEDIPSLLQSGVVTIIEFGASWCGPCQQNKRGLEAICEAFRVRPPPVTVRFYSIDIEAPGNEEVSRAYTPGGTVPHLYFYVGSTEKAHYTYGIEPDTMQRLVAEQVEYASTSGAARGAKKGLGWGALVGGLAGIGGAIAIGTSSGLEGNALMGAIIGSVAGGAAVGLGIGAAIGAIAGHATDDRNQGPRQQRRRHLQPKSRSHNNDPLEREAERVATDIELGRPAAVHQSSTRPSLARLTRGEKAAAGAGIGAGSGAALGAGIGLIAASQMRGTPFGAAAGIGAAIGGVLGALIGGLIGAFTPRKSPVEAPEAEVAIRRRFGAYLPGGVGALNNAVVHPVNHTELCTWYRCRFGAEASCNIDGWTDTGREPPNQIASAADEPMCPNGQQLEHATPQRPVIYFDRERRDAGLMVHEGVHAYESQTFGIQMRNGVSEGTTEYFTRQILPDLNIPRENVYDEQVAEVTRMIPIVGEEKLRRGYFLGEMDALHQAANSVLGGCALTEWAFAVQTLNFDGDKPRRIIAGRNQNYCHDGQTTDTAPEAAPPADERPA